MAQWKPPPYAIPYEQPKEQQWTPPPYAKPYDPNSVEKKWVPPPYAGRPEIEPPLDFDLPPKQVSTEARQPDAPQSWLSKAYDTVSKGALDYLPENL